MPKFVLVEQSLRDVGGHYLEYALEILHAAQEQGFEPILAANRKFTDLSAVPGKWKTYSLFPNPWSRLYRPPNAKPIGLWKQLRTSKLDIRVVPPYLIRAAAERYKFSSAEWRLVRRRRRVEGFASACKELFSKVKLAPGDQVFCCTMADLDLLGLASYLSRNEESQPADWHLQFHYSLFTGRDPDYSKQDKYIRRLRRRFSTLRTRLRNHQLHFYCTTDELCRQHERLDGTPFESLPWPVGERFKNAGDSQRGDAGGRARFSAANADQEQTRARRKTTLTPACSSGPLRVVCAGEIRREKGADRLGQIVRSMGNDLLDSGKVQLLFQVDKRKRSRGMTGLPDGMVTDVDTYDASRLPSAPVLSIPHPLSSDSYTQLIKNTDIGLLLYNSHVYFARCSGILVELLAAGVPVVVPAGCWLSEQIADENYSYLDRLLASSSIVQRWQIGPDAFLQRNDRGIVIDKEFDLENRGADLVVRLNWAEAPSSGCFVNILVEQSDEHGRGVASLEFPLGPGRKLHDRTCRPVSSLFHVDSRTKRMRVKISNAYSQELLPVSEVDVLLLNTADGECRQQPMGSIGLSMASPEYAPQLVGDMARYYDHYRRASQAFAEKWREQHAPARTIEVLIANSQATRRGALRSAG